MYSPAYSRQTHSGACSKWPSTKNVLADLPHMHRMPEQQCSHNADESPCRPRISLSLFSRMSPASHIHTIYTHGTDLNPGCMHMAYMALHRLHVQRSSLLRCLTYICMHGSSFFVASRRKQEKKKISDVQRRQPGVIKGV